ncbi:MAG TPA: hypothetical protein VFS25_10010 [Chitinophaga sp.]|uniref:hypothetical protein n=1 Tax=Chitinophaga sp. TaxID=1869181 RepID=UPI002DB9FD3E|nr:hypothetical protein [Chitinophaga sp.]HEU4553160.1 hypothetical protein [Chitinophaga sp.]
MTIHSPATGNKRSNVASANSFSSQSPAVAFNDNRPEIRLQKAWQKMASNSSHVRQQQALQRMANSHVAVTQMGVLSARPGVVTSHIPAKVIQRTAGIIYADGNNWVIYTKNGGFGPYTIANIAVIPPNLLQANTEVDYTNQGHGIVWINRIGTTAFPAPVQVAPQQQNTASPIDTSHFINNRIGLGNTAKTSGKDRPWLKGTNFNVDFGGTVGTVSMNSLAQHQPLHEGSEETQGFRGNSVNLSWSLYYEDNSGLQQSHFKLPNFSKFRSADFGQYTNQDLNDMYAAGRLITGHEGYNKQEGLGVAAARYHSERDMVVKAEQLHSPTFARLIATKVNSIIGNGIPRLLILQLHSHEIRICDECYQFLEAFMQADWINDAKDLIDNGEQLKISMVTSADQPHPALTGSLSNARNDNATIGIGEMPNILNIGQLSPDKK